MQSYEYEHEFSFAVMTLLNVTGDALIREMVYCETLVYGLLDVVLNVYDVLMSLTTIRKLYWWLSLYR